MIVGWPFMSLCYADAGVYIYMYRERERERKRERERYPVEMTIARSGRKLYPRQRTNVIFMTMCYDHCFNFVAPFLDECGIRYNFLNTKLIIAEIQVTHDPGSIQQVQQHNW